MRTTIIAALLLSACASTGLRVTGTEHTVAVNCADAQHYEVIPAAEAHCAKYGKHAQFAGKSSDLTDAFNCVK